MGRKYPSVVRATSRRFNDLEKSRKPTTSDMDRPLLNVLYATSAGFCSSFAGSFGKIGMGVDEFFGIDNQVRAHRQRFATVPVSRVFFPLLHRPFTHTLPDSSW